MLTGTCDACRETMSFDDGQAGITVRCKQCGQGWVHVALAQGIAESASAIKEGRTTSLPDTAMTADLPMTVDVADVTFRLVAGTCPRCGSPSFTKLKAKRGTTLTYDRECSMCGTRCMTIPAQESSIVQIAFQLSGVAVILGGVLAALIQLALTAGPARLGGGSFRLYGVLFSVMAGSRMFLLPQQMRELREKRLK
jgi:transcription elongation factor Elf1